MVPEVSATSGKSDETGRAKPTKPGGFMHFEVVTKQTPREGVLYHGRFKLDDEDSVIWRTELYRKKEGVTACINLLVDNAATAEVVEVYE